MPLVSHCCYIIHIVVGMETMKHDTTTAGQKGKGKKRGQLHQAAPFTGSLLNDDLHYVAHEKEQLV